MTKITTRRAAALTSLALLAIGFTQIAQGAANVSSPSASNESISYTKPTGRELTPAGAAEHALNALKRNVSPGTARIKSRVVHGSFGQLRLVLDSAGPESGPPLAKGSARCFPGLPCQPAEVAHMEQLEREVSESSAYLIEITGATFTPPRGLLPRGQVGISGKIESVIVDAHTGTVESEMINGLPVAMEGLGTTSTFIATLSEAGVAAIASVHETANRIVTGGIEGHVVGPNVAHLPLVLSVVGHGRPLEGEVVRRSVVSSRGEFTINDVAPGSYGIGVRRGGCEGRHMKVRPGRITRITLSCT